MPNSDKPRRRSSDQYILAKQVFVGVVILIIFGVLVWCVNMPNTYASKDDLEKAQQECAEGQKQVDQKLDTILDLARKLDKRSEVRARDIEHIREKLDEEIERSTESDKELKERIRALE